MSQQNICIMISIIAYLLVVLGIGVWFSRRNKTADDFYLGGRKLGPFVTAMSAEASDMSSYLLMGVPGLAFLTGLADASWTAIGLIIGTYLNWLIVAKKLRRYSSKIGATTLPAFFSERFKDKSRILSIIAAIVIIIFFVPYTASGFAACGKLFNSLFGVDYMVAMLICAFVIILYTMLGGFLAASTSDFLQSIVMTIALVIVLVYGVVNAGGIGAVVENAKALPGYLSLSNIYVPETGGSEVYGAFRACSMLAWGLGYFGMPHILLRFMAIEDAKKLKLSRRVASLWCLISLGIAVFIGIVGMGLVKNSVMAAPEDSERILIEISKLLSQHGVFAAIVAGVILAGILAATMSTADSQLLAASSSVSQNIVKEKLFPKMTEETTMIIARFTLVAIAVVAVFLARDPNSSVFGIVSFAWAGFGAAFGPVMLAALFWKRTTKAGALAGMIAGGAMVFIWKYGIATLGGVLAIYELLPAFITGLIAIIVVSLLTKAPEKEITDTFDAVTAMKD
ncbi:MAG: sodium/proline symporter [Oscillospiraceae bacterium]|nr:sodium/proline symporter [Oscillospiraceae bacterium]